MTPLTSGVAQTQRIYDYEEAVIKELELQGLTIQLSLEEAKELADRISRDCRIDDIRVFDGRGQSVGSGGYEKETVVLENGNVMVDCYLFIRLPKRFRNIVDAIHEITHCIVMCRRHRHKFNSHLALEDHDAVFLKLFLRLLRKYVKLPKGFGKRWFKVEAEKYGLEW